MEAPSKLAYSCIIAVIALTAEAWRAPHPRGGYAPTPFSTRITRIDLLATQKCQRLYRTKHCTHARQLVNVASA